MSKEWTEDEEFVYKQQIENYFADKIKQELKENSPLYIGNKLADILKKSDNDVVRMITPRAVRKWASNETYDTWKKITENDTTLFELREIGKSIANTMRPLAGNNFAIWVAKLLNEYFKQEKLPLEAITKGKIKLKLSKDLIAKSADGDKDLKPDLDIIIVDNRNSKPLAIISAKTTLAERIMQTINWARYVKELPQEIRNIKIYLVTAWEDFTSGANRERVQELDAVFVCNDVKEYGNIKQFSKIGDELKTLINLK